IDIRQQAPISSQSAITLPHVISQKVSISFPFFNNSLRDLRLRNARSYGANGVDKILNALDVAKAQIQGSRLSENEKTLLVAEIDSNATWFESKKSDINSASDLATVKSIGKDVNDRWNVEKVAIKKQAGDIACDQYEVNIAEARSASLLAAGKISAIKAQGKDTAAMDKKLASYNSHVNKAAGYLGNARADFNKINGPALADVRFSTGLRQLNLAGNELNNAYSDLKGLYGLIYQNNTTVKP
ncbi:MAG TPA: hypothetical protein VGK13_06125, partial [Methanocellaceae archaeon]